jgi:hypothetical protein
MNVENLGNMVPDAWYSLYHFSHPPLVERLRALNLTDGSFLTAKDEREDVTIVKADDKEDKKAKKEKKEVKKDTKKTK